MKAEITYKVKGKDNYLSIIDDGIRWVKVSIISEAWVPRQQLIEYLKSPTGDAQSDFKPAGGI